MKKLLIFLAILSFCFSSVSALQVSTPTLGSSSAVHDTSVETTLTITNEGSSTLTGFGITTTADDKYKVTFENVPQSLAAGQSAVVKVKGYIPKDISGGKNKIGTLTVTSSVLSTSISSSAQDSFGTHDFNQEQQSPDEVVVPVGMSAANDQGTNTPDPNMPIIGQWHVGTINGITDIEVMSPHSGSVDAGWARVHSDKITDYWVSPVQLDCNGPNVAPPPNNWIFGGKIHTGPGVCDGKLELPSGDSGWMGFYSRPDADGKLLLVIAEDLGGQSAENVPGNGVVLGKVKTGPYTVDGMPEAVSYTGRVLDAGSMFVVWVPVDHTQVNIAPVGELESVTSTAIKGWAFDADAPSINVDVFVDGTFWKTLQADLPRADLVTAGKIPDENHGFEYTFTDSDKSSLDFSKNHTFDAYAINSPVGDNTLLNGSGVVLVNSTSSSGSGSGNGSGSGGGSGSTSTSATVDLFMETGVSLVIDKVKIVCDKSETVKEGSNIEVVPDTVCYLTVKVENDGTLDFEDVELEVASDSSDIDGDSAAISSLDAGDDEEKTLEIEIDQDADDGKVKMILKVEVEDENGGKHFAQMSFNIEVERPKHELKVTKVTVSPSEAKLCEFSRIDVTVYVENSGQKDEDEVAVELSVPGLNFVKKLSDLSIDESEEERFTFSIPLNENSPAGTFAATAQAFYDNSAKSGSKTANVVVTKCAEVVSQPQGGSSKFTQPVVVPPPKVEVIQQPESSDNKSLLNGSVMTAVLVLANLVALTVLGVMAYGFFRKKEPEFGSQFVDDKSEEFEQKDYY